MSRRFAISLPNQIRRYRHERHLRLRDVCRLVGIRDVSHIAHWEKGRKIPNLENALRLSAAIGCPVEVLFSDIYRSIQEETHDRRTRFHIKLQFD